MAERRLPAGVAEAWWLDLDARHVPCLSPDEAVRVGRCRDPVAARRWSASRTALRTVLGAYLDYGPEALDFVLGTFGKPSHAPVGGLPRVEFSLSHSGPHGLLVVCRSPVGADVEEIRHGLAVGPTASSALSPREAEAWRRLPEAERVRGFFRAWTSRESVLKALGVGFVGPHAPFDVRVDPAVPPGLAAGACEWCLHALDAPRDCCAVVATRVGDVVRAHPGRWPHDSPTGATGG